LEAAKLLLRLARSAAKGEYTSPEGKSPYQLLEDWLGVVEKYAEEVGLDQDELESSKQNKKDEETQDETAYDSSTDPRSKQKLDIESIIRSDGLAKYHDQSGRLWTGLATYWIKRGQFDLAKASFEAGLAYVLTIRDFTQIFDAYAEFSETLISALMDAAEDDEGDEDGELDKEMMEFEKLMDRRPFLVNDVLLRRNPNDVTEWEKRVALWGDDDAKVQ
jgi:pre-mRNA-splicing factor SYF1